MSGHGGPELPEAHGDDPFTKKIALCVAVYAVVLALAATGGKNAGKDMIGEQLNASNTWNQYQAKTQREVLYQQELEALQSEGLDLNAAEIETLAKEYEAKRKIRKLPTEPAERKKLRYAFISVKLNEYTAEKKELSDKAKGHEKIRDTAHEKDPYFDYSELLLQIAIVLASVAMLSKTRWAFVLSVALAGIGFLLAMNGFTLLLKIPFLSEGH